MCKFNSLSKWINFFCINTTTIRFMTDEEAIIYDSEMIALDWEVVGRDIQVGIDIVDKEIKNRKVNDAK